MSKRKRRTFTTEQKADAVRLVRVSGESIPTIARDLNLPENSLRNWVKQAEVDEGRGPTGALTTEEREELRRLRKENRTLTMERDFLNKLRPTSPRRNRRIRNDSCGEGQFLRCVHVQAARRLHQWLLQLGAPSCASVSAGRRCSAAVDSQGPQRQQGHLWEPAHPCGTERRRRARSRPVKWCNNPSHHPAI